MALRSIKKTACMGLQKRLFHSEFIRDVSRKFPVVDDLQKLNLDQKTLDLLQSNKLTNCQDIIDIQAKDLKKYQKKMDGIDLIKLREKATEVTKTVPTWLQGLWTRKSIVLTSSGDIDDTTRVIYLQTPSFYSDIRIPANRNVKSLEDPSVAEASSLAFQLGDYGICSVQFEPSTKAETALVPRAARKNLFVPTARWNAITNYQPVVMYPEPGFLYLSSKKDQMTEEPPSKTYIEDWRRVPNSNKGINSSFALLEERLVETDELTCNRGALLVSGGVHCILVRDRFQVEFPQSKQKNLSELVKLHFKEKDFIRSLFACEYSYAILKDGRWKIQLSTIPSYEGKTLRDNDEWKLLDEESEKRPVCQQICTAFVNHLQPVEKKVRRKWRIDSWKEH